MKISIITVIYNGKAYLEECIKSVISQSYTDIEYIIVDGGSTDGSLRVIENYRYAVNHFISEPDHGLYDAINKGIRMATGTVIGILNADDVLADHQVIEHVAAKFTENPETDAVYGDLHYIKPVSNQVLRTWKSKQAGKKDIAKGWMPAHPTLYIKKELFERYGNYALDMGTAADYDLILRYFYIHQLKAVYLPMLMVNMRIGGVSNKNLWSLVAALKNDYKALKRNGIPNPLRALWLKKFSKIIQYR